MIRLLALPWGLMAPYGSQSQSPIRLVALAPQAQSNSLACLKANFFTMSPIPLQDRMARFGLLMRGTTKLAK